MAVVVDPHGGQRGSHPGGERQIVPAGDAEILGRPPAACGRPPDRSGGQQVVVGQHRGDPGALRKLRDGAQRPLGIPAAVDRGPRRQVELGESALERLAAPTGRGMAVIAAEVQELAMTELDQVRDHLRHPVRLRERAHAAQLPVVHRRRDDRCGAQPLPLGLGQIGEREHRLVQPGVRELAHALGEPVPGGQGHHLDPEPGRLRRLVGPAQQLERMAHVPGRQHQRETAGGAVAHRARHEVRAVVQLGDGLVDVHREHRRDRRIAAQVPRDGLMRDPREACDIADRGAANGGHAGSSGVDGDGAQVTISQRVTVHPESWLSGASDRIPGPVTGVSSASMGAAVLVEARWLWGRRRAARGRLERE